jgi:hypothetical protein
MTRWMLAAMVMAAFVVGAIGQTSRPASAAATQWADVDWDYARKLLDKSGRHENLTPDEQAYLDNAKRIRAAAQGRSTRPATGPAASQSAGTGLIPLDQMTADQKYKDQDGGLYGGGRNDPPEAHAKAAMAELAKVRPLDENGRPDANGKIVLLAIGMSNTTQEFSRFKQLADRDSAKSPAVVIVDGAQGGKDAAAWSEKAPADTWTTALARLKAAGVTPEQVQVMWVKHARIQPEKYGEFPAHAKELKDHIVSSLQIARKKFPNLRVAYLSSRIYAGWARTRLNPEPFAYEGAFAMRWIIQEQAKGAGALNFDASKGEVKAPLVLWGPYLWADGLTPRKSDGLVWKQEDLAPDGTHPSAESGREKVAKLLLDFLKTSPYAKGWFCAAK